MSLTFEEWYKKNLEQEIVDTYYEGSFDISYIEHILKLAYEAGYDEGYAQGYDDAPGGFT